jgi:hypothetical protein
MILSENLTKEQRVVQAEINADPIEGMSFEKYRKTSKEKHDLKEAKAACKA